jgi:Ca2+-binding EF-hand superfamily protein
MTNRWLTKAGIGLLGGALALPGVAFAHDAASKFKELDSNDDGRISLAEFEAGTDKKFKSMDADGNGRVTTAEMDAVKAKLGGESRTAPRAGTSTADRVKVLDTDGDGTVSAQEMNARARAKFDAWDTNRDGYLSKNELRTGYEKKEAAEKRDVPEKEKPSL